MTKKREPGKRTGCHEGVGPSTGAGQRPAVYTGPTTRKSSADTLDARDEVAGERAQGHRDPR
jgi:hypothetical protein